MAEGKRRVLGKLGSGAQSLQVKPGWAAYVIVMLQNASDKNYQNREYIYMDNKAAITRILIFYSIAIVISNIFRFDLFQLEHFFEELPTWFMVLYGPLQALVQMHITNLEK